MFPVMKSELTISAIWEDGSLLEVRVTASSAGFSGTADCYTNRAKLKMLAENLKYFPEERESEMNFSTGEKEGLSWFSLALKSLDSLGHSNLMVQIVNCTMGDTERSTVMLNLKPELQSIYEFGKALLQVAESPVGAYAATLRSET